MVPAAPRRAADPAPRRHPGGVLNGIWGHGGDYQTWTDYLRRWGEEGAAGTREAAALLPRLRQEDYHHETWVRLVNQLTAAVDRRLRSWADALTAALEEAADEFGAGRALVQSRTGLDTIRALAAHPSLPQDLREQLGKLVAGQIVGLQQQLEDMLNRAERGGADRQFIDGRRRTLRDNPLTTAGPGAAAAAPAPGEGWSYDPAGPARRRIMTD
ncbi:MULTISPECIES: hypothetical protein [unclassified Streptomyces]|uniref:hypothetical protein n=1 Tax=unclassified Streptomyces TaxID=2593676 RepID=UPI001BEB44C7|nr:MULTISPECIES: hypothetical protein [unclassified Streptomyces]MBT2405116.1 hypothetical protein [Streptomyces sp. ISL-21]MBT2458711.1 hypothetical protein [Streptomyces sp. ISL-86]MBT2610884.1 hypothetical protein [Streptomyces sp. ISL-87]